MTGTTTSESTPAFRFLVTKGCPDIGVRKGVRNEGTICRTAVGKDTCLLLDTSSKVANGRILWLSGNRVNLPTITVGMKINLNDGNPLHRVVVEVVSA